MDVLLYATQNPKNLGSIIRTSVELGLPRIHIYDKFDLLNGERNNKDVENVCRRGRRGKVEIISVEDPLNFVSEYEHVYATTLAQRSLKLGIGEWSFEKDALIIFGGESDGVPRKIARRHGVHKITIPNFENERCLSLTVAYGIIIYEFLRQHPEFFPRYKSYQQNSHLIN